MESKYARAFERFGRVIVDRGAFAGMLDADFNFSSIPDKFHPMKLYCFRLERIRVKFGTHLGVPEDKSQFLDTSPVGRRLQRTMILALGAPKSLYTGFSGEETRDLLFYIWPRQLTLGHEEAAAILPQ